MRPAQVEHLLAARLLVLQSKRLLLASADRLATRRGTERLRARVERLRNEVENLDAAYQKSVLRLASPQHPDYWPIAYGRLIVLADELTSALRNASPSVGPYDRSAISTDIEALERLVEDWRESIRRKIAAA